MSQVTHGPLSREAFLKRIVIKSVQLDGGSTVCIRALPASMIVGTKEEDASKVFEAANLLAHSLCDENGNLFFSGEEKDKVMTVDHVSLKKIMDAIVDLNGLNPGKNSEESDPGKN